MKTFMQLRNEYIRKNKKKQEETPANAVAHGGVDLSPGIRKQDGRHKYSIGKMFRRNEGRK